MLRTNSSAVSNLHKIKDEYVNIACGAGISSNFQDPRQDPSALSFGNW